MAHLADPGAAGHFGELEAVQVGDLVVAIVADEQVGVGALVPAQVASFGEFGHLGALVVRRDDVRLRFSLDSRLPDYFLPAIGLLVGVQAEAGDFAERAAVGDFGPLLDAHKAEEVLAAVHPCARLRLFQADHASDRL